MNDQDKGHENLIQHLELLLKEAKGFHFHDFKNSNYAAPKSTLREKLLQMVDNISAGIYDN